MTEETLAKFIALENRCKKLGPLELKESDGSNYKKYQLKEYSNFKEFIEDFIININYISNVFTFKLDSNSAQCNFGKNRSLEDLFRLVNNYYPEITILELAKALITPNNQLLQSICCPDISKIVFANRDTKRYCRNFPDCIEREEEYKTINVFPFSLGSKLVDDLFYSDYAQLLD